MTSNHLTRQETGSITQLPEANIDEGLKRLERLLPSLKNSKQDRETAHEIAVSLGKPVNNTWLLARVTTLLNPYFEKEMTESLRKMELEDWVRALSGRPQWAIDRAVRWWKSVENPDRRKRPLEGDIAARVNIEMAAVARVRSALRKPVEQIEHKINRVDPAAAKKIIEEAGFRARNVPN